jgi:hypothetical protein
MIEPMTREEADRLFREIVADVRRRYPQGTVECVAPPIDPEKLRALAPGPFYEGFLEDVRRMRCGLEPLGPRE